MNALLSAVRTLTTGAGDSGFGVWLRRVYFALAYNTVFPYNALVAVGTMTPYLAYLAATGHENLETYLHAVLITGISAYCYNLIYIINDYIDRAKDAEKGIPKRTARNIFGDRLYLVVSLGGFILVTGMAALLWPHLTLFLLAYTVFLALLSVLHSTAAAIKPLTLFAERAAKFSSPLWLWYLAGERPDALPFLAGALLLFPLGFMMDYAYRGYFRERLKRPMYHRFAIYTVYWLTVIAWLLADHTHFSLASLPGAALFALAYLAAWAVAALAAPRLPLARLDEMYDPVTATEKRLILAYGGVQALLLLGGLVYAIAS